MIQIISKDNKKYEKKSRTALLVLGMHCSGASALTRVLSLAGAGLPHLMVNAAEENKVGRLESRELILTNDRILESIGLAWFDWRPPEWNKISLHERTLLEDELKRVIATEFSDSDFIVLKDPRICRLASPYLSVLNELNYQVVPIIPYRQPIEAMRALKSRTNWPQDRTDVDASMLWLVHTLEAEMATRQLPRIFVSYDRLLSDWVGVLEDIERGGGIKLPTRPEKIRLAVEEFLNPEERHHQSDGAGLSSDRVTMRWVRAVYDSLRELEIAPFSSTALANLDVVRSHVDAAIPMSLEALDERSVAYRNCEQARLAEASKRTKAEQRVAEVTTALDEARREAEVQTRLFDEKAVELRSQIEQLIAAEDALQAGMQNERDAIDRNFKTIMEEREEFYVRLLQNQEREFRSSKSWRLTAPLRTLGQMARTIHNFPGKLRAAIAIAGGVTPAIKAAGRVIHSQGFNGLMVRLQQIAANDLLTGNTLNSSAKNEINYVNRMSAKRKEVLFSDWHISLIRAIRDERPASSEGNTLGISIVTYNSARWLPRFFDSLLKQRFPLSRLNLMIIDHGSTDETVSMIKEHSSEHGKNYASFRLYIRPNLGFGAGHDYAIRLLQDDFVLVTNVDLCFHQDTLTRALRAATADRVDVASWELRQCPYEHPKYYDPVTLETIWSSHACIVLRRQAYIDVGGYDHKLFMYGEDVELSYRFRGQGWTLRYLPQVSVTHFVDLHDPELRPNQLSGSLAANVLLRYRYGGEFVGQEGEQLLATLLSKERNPVRRASIIEAQRLIFLNKDHFCTAFKPTHPVDFPFSDFDYVLSREGATVPLDSSVPADSQPLVTIVTRTHGPKTGMLREALTSTINQSYTHIEHIIVEDRTDYARAMVQKVADTYELNVRYLKSNGSGRSEAGNFGLENAEGELLMMLDNDDIIFCDHVELLQNKLKKSHDCVASYALSWDVHTIYLEDGSYVELKHTLPIGHRYKYNRNRLKEMNFIPIQSILFRRALFEEEGGFNVNIDHLEDWNLWDRYANYGNFIMVPKVTSMYRTPGDTAVRAKRQRELDDAYTMVKTLNADRRRQITQKILSESGAKFEESEP